MWWTLPRHNACWVKMCLLNEKCVYWAEKCLLKGVHWKVITLHIGYTKRCLLIEKMLVGQKCAYQKVSIERSQSFILDIQKDVYWLKKCLLVENVSIKRCLLKCHNLSYWIFKKMSIDRKDAYWPKRCLLKCHNSSY